MLLPTQSIINSAESEQMRIDGKLVNSLMSRSKQFIVIQPNLRVPYENLVSVDGKPALYYKLKDEITKGLVHFDEDSNTFE